jgi:hypothetical protein
MEKTFEGRMRAHERGVSVLSKLAMSFGVTPTEADHERQLVLLSVSREIDDATLQEGFYAGVCHKALLGGDAYGEFIPKQLSERFKSLYDSSEEAERDKLDSFVHGIVQHNATIRGQRLEHLDVMRDSVNHKSKISQFEEALENDARYRAKLFALPRAGSPYEEALYREENANRVRYNAWLEDFYVAYEHLGALAHANRDRKKGRHGVDAVGGQQSSQTWLTVRSLARCVAGGRPRTVGALLTHGSARVARKIVGRL